MQTTPQTLANLFAELSRVCAAGLAGVPSDELLRMIADSGHVQRGIDAIRVHLAGHLVELSAAHFGQDGIARQAGHRQPAAFLAELWQISVPEAARLCDVGTAIRPRRALDGTPLPARYEMVAAAVQSRELGVEAAAVIIRYLEQAAPYCSAEARAAGERVLVEHAPALTVKQVDALARQVRDRLDDDGTEPRDAIRRQRRSLTLMPQSDGMVRLVWDMPPETAGLVRTGIDDLVSDQLRQKRRRVQGSLASDGVADVDDRTMPQRRADAAEELLRHAVSCDRGDPDRPVVTMVVRMTLDQLCERLGTAGVSSAGIGTAEISTAGFGTAGFGTAHIDGVEAAISASSARILAADANIIPVVLGGNGEVLDLGRSRRLFTRAQRHALAETYGGCAFSGCDHPPSHTEAHHLVWWSNGGRTDLDNAIPLCSFHHHRVHDDGWEIAVRGGIPYFIPPPWIDPDRTPRRGGKVDLVASG